MEALSSRLKPDARSRHRLGLLLVLLCAPGCTLDQYWTSKDASPPAGHPCEVATAWLNRVQYTPDVAHDGVSTPGLVCRVYLFDETEKFPLVGDGAVTIDLFDDTHGPATQQLERWYIDPATLRKFLKKDTVGMGYTLFLPWGSCRPDVTKVHLACKYEPLSGQALFGPVTPLTLEHVPPPDGSQVAAPLAAANPPAALPQLTMPTPLK